MNEEALRKALTQAFRMGQDYWYNADHEFSSRWKKADEIKAKFDQLVEDTVKSILEEGVRK
jgi:hypothetical protein